MSADGAWKINITTPMGPQDVEAVITTSGDTFTGKMSGKMGEQDIAGTVEGDTLRFTTDIKQPMPLTLKFEAKVDGDSMAGTVQLGMFGTAPLKGQRA